MKSSPGDPSLPPPMVVAASLPVQEGGTAMLLQGVPRENKQRDAHS